MDVLSVGDDFGEVTVRCGRREECGWGPSGRTKSEKHAAYMSFSTVWLCRPQFQAWVRLYHKGTIVASPKAPLRNGAFEWIRSVILNVPRRDWSLEPRQRQVRLKLQL